MIKRDKYQVELTSKLYRKTIGDDIDQSGR